MSDDDDTPVPVKQIWGARTIGTETVYSWYDNATDVPLRGDAELVTAWITDWTATTRESAQ